MRQATEVPVSEYLSTDYTPDVDYVDGELLERNVGERDHSQLQMRLSAYLFNRHKEWGIYVYPGQRVQISPTRFREVKDGFLRTENPAIVVPLSEIFPS